MERSFEISINFYTFNLLVRIILAPVIANEDSLYKLENTILPLEKPKIK